MTSSVYAAIRRFFPVFIGLFLYAGSACAFAPTTMTYQGRLTDNSGVPINTSVNMVFSLYTQSSGGTAIWTESHTGVSVSGGVFQVILGSQGTPLDRSDFSGPLYLGIAVGGDAEMTPRLPLASSGYSLASSNVTLSLTVDCPTDSLQDAINDASPGVNLSITVKGTCPEDIDIRRDGVTLIGGASGKVEGQNTGDQTIVVEGATNVFIKGLTVDPAVAGGTSVFIWKNSHVEISDGSVVAGEINYRHNSIGVIDSSVSFGANPVVTVQEGSQVDLNANLTGDVNIWGGRANISGNLIGNLGIGIQSEVNISGAVNVTGSGINVINSYSSLTLQSGASLTFSVPAYLEAMRGWMASGSSITASQGISFRFGSHFTVDGGASLTVTAEEIWVDDSQLNINGTVTSPNVRLTDTGKLVVADTATVNADINLQDWTSAEFRGNNSAATVTGDINLNEPSYLDFGYGTNYPPILTGNINCVPNGTNLRGTIPFYTGAIDPDCNEELDRVLVVSSVTGNGTVTSDASPYQGPLNCANGATGNCRANFSKDDSVNMTAAPDSGWEFDSWGGDCSVLTLATDSIVMSSNKTCSVTFVETSP
ncbi:hypothetical protein ACFL1S_05010 [Pseudomonadota bacterium]